MTAGVRFFGKRMSSLTSTCFLSECWADSTRLLARHRILMYQAEVAAWRGHYADARNLLRKVDSDVNPANGFLDQSITWSSRGRDVLESEILAFQGPQGDLLVRAEAIEFEGNTDAAIGLYRQAMSASSADPDAYGYLRDRIALLEVGQPAEKNAEPVLSVAVKQEAVDVVEFLIKHGADLQREDFYFWTPLHHAASVGNIQIANLLLDNGADLNARCMGFATPLHLSIKNHHPDMTRLLLDRQADVNASDNGRLDGIGQWHWATVSRILRLI